MAGGGPPVAFATPARPLEDLGGVPGAHFQQVMQQGAHFRHTDLFLFFPPTAASAAPGTPTPAWTGPCGDASPPSPVFHTRPAHIPPWPTGCLPRSSTSSRAPPPASPAAPRPGHWSGDTSAPAPERCSASPTAALSGQAAPPHGTTPTPRHTRRLLVPGCPPPPSPAATPWPARRR